MLVVQDRDGNVLRKCLKKIEGRNEVSGSERAEDH